MFRFADIDVSSVGSFGSGPLPQLPSERNLIAGEGSGLSAICKALHRQWDAVPASQKRGIPRWMVFWEDAVNIEDYLGLPGGGESWEPLSRLMSSWPVFRSRRRWFERDLERHLHRLLRVKIDDNPSKFSGRVSSAANLRVTVNDCGAVKVRDIDGSDLDDCFQAHGERLAMYLAVNAAARNLLALDLPSVVNGQLGFLDRTLLHTCYSCLELLSRQTIVLESNAVFEALGVTPHWQVVHDPVRAVATIDRVLS